jgi:ribosome-associated translation inhibitor RaiA
MIPPNPTRYVELATEFHLDGLDNATRTALRAAIERNVERAFRRFKFAIQRVVVVLSRAKYRDTEATFTAVARVEVAEGYGHLVVASATARRPHEVLEAAIREAWEETELRVRSVTQPDLAMRYQNAG